MYDTNVYAYNTYFYTGGNLLQTDVHFIYPAFAFTNSCIVYGHYFIPLLDPPGAFYVTVKSQQEASELIFKALSDLWPLLVIGLLMAILAGFVAWLMETWNNKIEFPRPFIRGWLEGEFYVSISNSSYQILTNNSGIKLF